MIVSARSVKDDPENNAHIPPEVEQEMTIEPPVKHFFGVLVIGAALVLADHLAGFPRLTKSETFQPPAQKAEVMPMPDQVSDRQALAAYQSLLGSGEFNALAEYQQPLGGRDFSRLGNPKLADVVQLPDLVQDRAYYSRLSDLLSSRPTEKLKTNQLSELSWMSTKKEGISGSRKVNRVH